MPSRRRTAAYCAPNTLNAPLNAVSSKGANTIGQCASRPGVRFANGIIGSLDRWLDEGSRGMADAESCKADNLVEAPVSGEELPVTWNRASSPASWRTAICLCAAEALSAIFFRCTNDVSRIGCESPAVTRTTAAASRKRHARRNAIDALQCCFIGSGTLTPASRGRI